MSHHPFPTVQPPLQPRTARLLLRQWREADKGPFADLCADPVVMEFFPEPSPREKSYAAVDRLSRQIEQRGWGLWAVEVAATAEFIGFVGLQVPVTPFSFSPCVEVGWRLARTAWGHGYATEAAQAALKAGFDSIGLAEIVSFTSLTNTRSRAVMERLGMVQDAETFMHPGIAVGHPLREHCLYRLSAAHWRQLNAAGS